MPQPNRVRWTRDELLIVLNLYHKIPFGKISSRQPVIIDLASRMGRTPASVSMKLGNLARISHTPFRRRAAGLGFSGSLASDRFFALSRRDFPAFV